MKLNLPNKMTILRFILVPVFVACVLYIPNVIACSLISLAVFLATAFTDFLDGRFARKYNMITNFGKFMDSLADKFMIFCSFLVLTVKSEGALRHVMVWASLLIFLRELGVTSIRLVCAKCEVGVVAASFFGKVKTCVQIACVGLLLLEPIFAEYTHWIVSYVVVGLTIIVTLGSGYDYLRTYWKYLFDEVETEEGFKEKTEEETKEETEE